MHSGVCVRLRKKAQVCSGRERFNIMKPNYTWPAIALYPFIESTELACESSHFSQVNKKSSAVIDNIFAAFLHLPWLHRRQFKKKSAIVSLILYHRHPPRFALFAKYIYLLDFNFAPVCVSAVGSRGSCLPGQPTSVWVAKTQREAISSAAARGKGRRVKCHNPASLEGCGRWELFFSWRRIPCAPPTPRAPPLWPPDHVGRYQLCNKLKYFTKMKKARVPSGGPILVQMWMLVSVAALSQEMEPCVWWWSVR